MANNGKFQEKARILVVDDEEMVLEVLERLLTEYGYEFQGSLSGEEALQIVEEDPPDLVLLDIKMKGINGLEVLTRIKNNKKLGYIPVIMLTSLESEKVDAFNRGADDFISKPPNRSDLFARINAHLRTKSYIEELERAEEVLFSMARIIEVKDKYTEEHTNRVVDISLRIGRIMGLIPKELDDLRKGAHLHDIGKVGIPDSILRKNGSLTPEEWEIIKEHTVIGEEICKPLSSLQGALPVIRHHHERWDGKGYPDGLGEHDIPFLARIVSVADAYDAMNSDRPYRKKLPREKILENLKEGSGKQWDPQIVEVLLDIIHEEDKRGSEREGIVPN